MYIVCVAIGNCLYRSKETRTGEMESGKYQPLDTAPYSAYPETIRLESALPQQRVTIQNFDISRTQVGICCMCCAIFNYLCCPRLGIPALIFAILGQEADKRRDVEAAKSHAYYAKVFNVIWAFLMIFNLCIILFCFGGFFFIIYTLYVLNGQIANLPTGLPGYA